MSDSYDAVVVGAGVIGAGVAWELARSGRRVLVVDKGRGAGLGSTSASASIVRFSYSTYPGVALSWEAKHAWEQWAEHLGAAPTDSLARFHRTGGLQLDFPGSTRPRVLELFDEVGVPYEEWSPDDVRRRVPALDPGRYYPPKALADDAFWVEPDGEVGGFYMPDAGFVDDPALAAQNLLDAALRAGAQVRFGADVREVLRESGRVAGVALAGGDLVTAPVVVNAAGPWSSQLNALAGVLDDFRLTTRALRQEVHHVTAPTGYELERPAPFVADGDLGTYFRPTLGGGVLVGGMEPECDPFVWVDDPDAASLDPTDECFQAQVTRLARRMPELTVPGRPKGVVGMYDVTEDWTPIYDGTSLPGYFVAIGTSGNQFKNAPTVGLLIRSLVDAADAGQADVRVTLPYTGLTVEMASWSCRRELNAASSFTVMG